MWRNAPCNKTQHLLPIAVIVAACGPRSEPQPVIPSRSPLAGAVMGKADPVAKGVPHGGDVVLVAVTEEADAALTADTLNSVRLWPALDGTRTPVPISFASEVAQLAITHAGRDLVAILRDRAGGISVLRLGLDGSVRGRAQLGGPQAVFEEVVTAGDQIFVRTADHALEWYAVDGPLRGRLQLEPGQRLTDLAARGGRVAAIVADGDVSYLRWVTTIGNTIRWEPALELPLPPRDGMFAIAPGRRRIAYVDRGNVGVHVLSLDMLPVPNEPEKQPFVNESSTSIGFLDDDTVGLAGFNVVWWRKAPAGEPQPVADPWAVPDSQPSLATNLSGLIPVSAYANGYVVSSQNGALTLASTSSVSYLGWDVGATGGFMPADEQIVLAQSGARFTWLDDDLQRARAIDLEKIKPAAASRAYGFPVDAHHALSQTLFATDSSIEIIDVDHPETRIPVLANKNIDQYFLGDGTLAVKVGKQMLRYKLDLAGKTAVEQMPRMTLKDYTFNFVRAFDPELANGLVAVTVSWPSDYSEHQALTYYRLVNGKITKQRDKKFDGTVVRADANGELVVLDRGRLRVIKDEKVVREIATSLATPLSFNAELTRFATREGTDIVVVDDTGKEVWRKSMWGAANMMFTHSGKRLVVAAPGGLVALDAETGEQVARECGYEFGLHDRPSELAPHGTASVCEDPIVQ